MVEKSFLEFICAFSSVCLVLWTCRHERLIQMRMNTKDDEEVISLSGDHPSSHAEIHIG